MIGEEDTKLPNGRKTFWRSASWSSSRSQAQNITDCVDSAEQSNSQFRHFPVPLTPRSQKNSKSRACLPPLQPLAIDRRSLDEWPKPSSDDVGEWPQPPTPSGKSVSNKPGEGLKLDLSSLDPTGGLVRRDKIAFFDKECSKVADHIYLGGDVVARDRDILRQNGITHVLNCVGFVCPEYFKADLVYKTLWLQDSPSEDITSILYDVFDYFEDVREQGGRVFVHCCQGVSRSTSLVIAYLMWREGQSFDDAFQYVKAARGIANPNMGFACQLLQCQKRVHAIPLSPSSVLRMYRMAPHSPYDALHLVPKMLNDPSPSALDSRGAFIIHIPSAIYVWIGKNCESVMERDAKTAALQVVRYERVQGPIITVEEGEEPSDFWDAFSNIPLRVDNSENSLDVKDQVKSTVGIAKGKKKVDAYDVDFEFFQKAITGGVVPPFPSPGAGHETHVPARESNWSILRHKFVSGSVKEWVSAPRVALCRVYSDSMLMVDADTRVNNTQLVSADSSSSPLYLSPSSLSSSDSSANSKCSSESPSLSPSTPSPSFAPSPTSSTLSNPLVLSSKSPGPPSVTHDAKPCLQKFLSTSKGSPLSLAERRGSSSPSLKLSSLTNESSLSSRRLGNACPREGIQEGNDNTSDSGYFDETSTGELLSESKQNAIEGRDICSKHSPQAGLGESVVCSTSHEEGDMGKISGEFQRKCPLQEGRELAVLTESIDSDSKFLKPTHPVIYRWPDLEKVVEFSAGVLDSKAVFLLLAPNTWLGKDNYRMLYLWIGSCFEHQNRRTHVDSNSSVGEVKETDWNCVGCNFLALMGLPKDTPIKVVKEGGEPKEFLELLNAF
ncbi:protein-tyrosine-phosphatase MKP1-like [Tasmannia lanceolata]|uniref:protein-tyrosine-phosphatase MKP1-like n=1 Tax=Tasmannia lanceolata TaxID=3420 RepID=UPI00406315B2